MAFKDMHHRIRLLEDQCYALTKENDDLRAERDALRAERDEFRELLEEVLPTAESYLCTYPDKYGKTLALFARANAALAGKQPQEGE